MATKKINSKKIEKRLDSVKNTIKDFNNGAFNLTNDLVDISIKNSDKWQKLFAKAMKGGVELMGKQQDYMFSNLEEVKDQFSYGFKRFKKLVKTEKPAPKKTSRKQAVA